MEINYKAIGGDPQIRRDKSKPDYQISTKHSADVGRLWTGCLGKCRLAGLPACCESRLLDLKLCRVLNL